MMKIVYEQTKHYKYKIESEFSMPLLNFFRFIKERYGWKSFNWSEKYWRFNNLEVVEDILIKYPNTVLSDTVKIDFLSYRKVKKEKLKSIEIINDIKNKSESSITDDDLTEIKGKLYEYQKIGVEFFDKNNGRAILSDEMGCISGEAVITVNRCGNAKKYKLKDAYKAFNGLNENDRYNWKNDSFIRSFNEELKEFKLNKINKIIYNGTQQTIKISAKCKNKIYSISLTQDHKLINNRYKWISADKLKIGDKILTNGKLLKYCDVCKKNTEHLLKKNEHFRIEGLTKTYRNFKHTFIPREAEIIRIEEDKLEDVYDIVMSDPHRNFIANGIIVHNCGKSIQTLAYCTYKKLKKVLIVCPASVKYSWRNEVKKWTNLTAVVINSNEVSNKNFIKITDNIDIVIVNYDILKKYFNELSSIKWNIIIADECHYLKNHKSIRSKAFKMLSDGVEKIILLSGTPLLNRPVELYHILNILDPVKWNNYYRFTKRYCAGHQGYFGYDASGVSNADELKEKISCYFLRRKKKDVLKQLPPKQFIDIPVYMDGNHRIEYDMAINSFEDYLFEVKNKNKQEVETSMRSEHLVKLGELRQITSRAKIETAKEIINNIISSEEKVVVFSCYRETMKELADYFGNISVSITGETSSKDREKAIDLFQNNSKIKIFIGGIKSAGSGLTLTAANNVLFLDFPWVPADLYQAIDRVHRPGQEADCISIYQLYAEETIDEHMKKILTEKQEVFNKIIEKEDIGDQSGITKDLINVMFNK